MISKSNDIPYLGCRSEKIDLIKEGWDKIQENSDIEINLERLGMLFDLITERYKIKLKRDAGNPKPWTDNKILQNYSFTNVFREKNEGLFSEALLTQTIERDKEVLNINTVGQLKEELDKYNDNDYIVFIDDSKTYNFKSICGKRNKIVIPGTTKEIDIRTCEVKLC